MRLALALRLGLLTVCLTLLCACAGVAIQERKWFAPVADPGPKEAIVIVFRHTAEVPGQAANRFADAPDLTVNGRSLGKLEQSNYRILKLPPGPIQIELNGVSPKYRIGGSFRTEAGRKLYVRLHSEEAAPSTGGIVPLPLPGFVMVGKRYLRYGFQAVDEQKALPEAAETYLRPGQESPVQF